MNLELSTKTKYRIFSNSRGNIIKRAVETYLRDDIPCNSQSCEECDPTNAKLFGSFYVVPQYDIIKHFYKLLEGFNLIICETLLFRCEKRRLYFHLKDLLRSEDHQVVSFCNEHFSALHKPNEEGLVSAFDSALWYARHLEDYGVMIIYLTSESLEQQEQQEHQDIPMNLMRMNMEQFVSFQKNQISDEEEYEKYVEKYKSLLEKIQDKKDDKQWESYLSDEEIKKGVDNSEIYCGEFRVNKHHSRFSHVIIDNSNLTRKQNEIIKNKNRIVVTDRIHRNRSVCFDEVYVRLFQESKWKKEDQPEGEIVGIYKRNWRERGYVVTLPDERTGGGGSANVLTVPLDRRIPKIRIRKGNRESLRHTRLLVRIVDWPPHSRYPNGQYLATIGRIGDIEVETKSLLVEHDLEWQSFSALALADLPRPDWAIPDEERMKRRDFRDVFTCSIDPVGCTDIDDAISIRYYDEDGSPVKIHSESYRPEMDEQIKKIEIGVHIADVSYFVRPGSSLDQEARLRSTSVYLVDRKHHMLPPVLSAGLCSLKMSEERLAVSVVWTYDAKTFEIENTWFGRSVISSNYSFHYDQVEHIISHGTNTPERIVTRWGWKACVIRSSQAIPSIRKMLIDIRDFARSVRKRRLTIGGLELDSLDEIRFTLDAKGTKPVEIHVHDNEGESHETITELMILANSDVARKNVEVYDRKKSSSSSKLSNDTSVFNSALLRVHRSPKENILLEVKKMAGLKGHEIETTSNVLFRKSLERAVDSKDQYYNVLLKAMATRSMNEAQYALAGNLLQVFERDKELSASSSSENTNKMTTPFYHYGLGLEYYTHFTSPIRRYSDLVVHRQIVDCLEQTSTDEEENKMIITKEMCDHMNKMKRRSRLLQSDSSRWFQALFFKQYEGMVLEGIVHKVTSKYLKVFIPNYRVNEVVFLTDRDGRLIYPILEEQNYFKKRMEEEEEENAQNDPFLINKQQQEENEGEDDDEDVKSPASIITSSGSGGTVDRNSRQSQNNMMVWNDDSFELEHDEKELSVNIQIFEDQKKKRNITYQVFDRVLVSIQVPEVRAHHPKIRLRLYSFEILKDDDDDHQTNFGEEISKDEYRDILKQVVRRKREEEKRDRMKQMKISKLLLPFQQTKGLFDHIDSIVTEKIKKKKIELCDDDDVDLEINEISKEVQRQRWMNQLNKIKRWLFRFGQENKNKKKKKSEGDQERIRNLKMFETELEQKLKLTV